MLTKPPHNEHEVELALVRRAGNDNQKTGIDRATTAIELTYGASVKFAGRYSVIPIHLLGLRRLPGARIGTPFTQSRWRICQCCRRLRRPSTG